MNQRYIFIFIHFLLLPTENSDQLFDKADEESDGDLFGRKSGGLFDDDYSNVTSPPTAKSKDDGDTDLFKQRGHGLFDETDEEVEDTPKKQPVSKPEPSTGSKPTVKSGGGGLFDDDSDSDIGGGDSFATASNAKVSQKDTTSAPSGKPVASSLFEDDGDLFGASPPEDVSGQKKKPVGGVSLFGEQSSAALNAAVKKVRLCIHITNVCTCAKFYHQAIPSKPLTFLLHDNHLGKSRTCIRYSIYTRVCAW